jgi:hypothetical protein
MAERILTKQEVDAIYTEHARQLKEMVDLFLFSDILDIIENPPAPPSTSPPSSTPATPPPV